MTAPPDSQRRQVLKRLASLKQERESWIAHWRDVSDMILPRRGRFLATDRNKGQRRNRKIIDNTGTMALRTMAAGLMSGITSPARPWFRLSAHQPRQMEDGEIKAWLADVERLMRDIFARSNAYDSLAVVYEELTAFGSAAMMVYEDYDHVISCETLTAGQYYLALGKHGTVDTLYREYSLSVAQLVDEFAPADGQGKRDWSGISPATRSLFEAGTLDAWVEVIQAIEPNRQSQSGRGQSGPGPAKAKPWRSVWLEAGASGDQVLRISGFDEFPAMCPRWTVAGGDIYGTAPAMDCLGDVEQLQAQERDKSLAIQKMVKPPLNVPSNLRKDSVVNALPNGTTFFDTSGAASPTMATPLYQVQPRLAEMQADMDAVRGRIRNAFYVDLWLMISDMDRSGITATEIDARREEKLLMLGPVLERLHHEFLNPLIDRVFNIAARADLLPPPPESLGGSDIQVVYTSMLAQAQRSVATAAIERVCGFVGNLAAANPQVLDKLDMDQAVDEFADAYGAPPRIIRSDKAVADIRQGRAQAQQQQAQAQQMAQSMQMAAQGAKTLSETDTGGQNALTDILSNVVGGA